MDLRYRTSMSVEPPRDFWNWFYFMFNIDSNHGFMVSYDVVKERMLSRLMGWQQMKYEKL